MIIKILLFILLSTCYGIHSAYAINIIRDSELENTIKIIAQPILYQAQLADYNIKIHIVDSKELNAFVDQNNDIFINAGIILASSDINMLAGVIAHEVGHIKAGHVILTQIKNKKDNLSYGLGLLLGMGGAVISKNADVTQAIILANESIRMNKQLNYSRHNETIADDIAINLLSKTNYNTRGLIELFNKLKIEDSLLAKYFSTHPLNQNRIEFFENHTKNNTEDSVPQRLQNAFRKAQAKLFAYLNPYSETMVEYATDSNIDIYAQAIGAYYRKKDSKLANKLLDQLLATDPRNPYLYEFKATILFEQGDKQALPAIQKAYSLSFEDTLIELQLISLLIEYRDSKLRQYIHRLENIIRKEGRTVALVKMLAMTYGITKQMAMSNLLLAEKEILLGNKENAKLLIKKSKTNEDRTILYQTELVRIEKLLEQKPR